MICFFLIVTIVFLYHVYDTDNLSCKDENDLVPQNIEALTQTEDVQMLKCTKATKRASCYTKSTVYVNNKWVEVEVWKCFIVKAVEEYTVAVGSPKVCSHDAISYCSQGYYEK